MIYRTEHPNPQFVREEWVNLNGEWDFAIDTGVSGLERGLVGGEGDGYDRKINVPFCPESRLSGVEVKDFMNAVWYRRSFNVTEKQLSGRVFIHFGAVDFETEVFINEKSVGKHKGGYTPFAFDITDYVTEGENFVVVFAKDLMGRNGAPRQGLGKQCMGYISKGCSYTRTTGIWQTVYLEFTPKSYIESFRVYPDIKNASLTVKGIVKGEGTVKLEAFYDGKPVGSTEKRCRDSFNAEIALSELHLWEVGNGRLYDLKLTFGDDVVKSYFGMRSVGLDGSRFLINGESVFQRLVLDQGFYPDGIYTARDDEELVRDINLSIAAGFNGARLHEKVFEPRFLYYCDKLGYIVWGEYPNWGLDLSTPEGFITVLPEWMEEMKRDFNHPSIIGWCPLNETLNYHLQSKQDPRCVAELYYMTKYYDETRPCIDTSGYTHEVTDIYDVHDYNQNAESFRARYDVLKEGKVLEFNTYYKQTHRGEPVFVSEYGGIGLDLTKPKDGGGTAWSYGNAARTRKEFAERYKGLTDAMLDNEKINGFCYTQLYDIEQEQNGLYTYEREPKVDIAAIHDINVRKAAIEE